MVSDIRNIINFSESFKNSSASVSTDIIVKTEKSLERCGIDLEYQKLKDTNGDRQTTVSVTLSIIKLMWTGLGLNPDAVVNDQRSWRLTA